MNEAPPERRQTIREALRQHLEQGWCSALDLSAAVGISEKAVPDHLEHLRKSLAGTPARLEVESALCLACNYTFSQRERLAKPSRCPKCRSERVEAPRFRIETVQGGRA